MARNNRSTGTATPAAATASAPATPPNAIPNNTALQEGRAAIQAFNEGSTKLQTASQRGVYALVLARSLDVIPADMLHKTANGEGKELQEQTRNIADRVFGFDHVNQTKNNDLGATAAQLQFIRKCAKAASYVLTKCNGSNLDQIITTTKSGRIRVLGSLIYLPKKEKDGSIVEHDDADALVSLTGEGSRTFATLLANATKHFEKVRGATNGDDKSAKSLKSLLGDGDMATRQASQSHVADSLVQTLQKTVQAGTKVSEGLKQSIKNVAALARELEIVDNDDPDANTLALSEVLAMAQHFDKQSDATKASLLTLFNTLENSEAFLEYAAGVHKARNAA